MRRTEGRSEESEGMWATPRKGGSSKEEDKGSPDGERMMIQSMLKLMQWMQAFKFKSLKQSRARRLRW